MNSKHITKKTQNLPKYKENKNKTSHLKNTTGETRNNTRFLLVFITYYLFVYNAAAAEFQLFKFANDHFTFTGKTQHKMQQKRPNCNRVMNLNHFNALYKIYIL